MCACEVAEFVFVFIFIFSACIMGSKILFLCLLQLGL